MFTNMIYEIALPLRKYINIFGVNVNVRLLMLLGFAFSPQLTEEMCLFD